MINIKIRCSNCFLKIACGDDFKGTKVSCPACKQKILIPAPYYNIGTDIHGFHIEQWLGNGAMAEVYLAKQVSMDREVALKVMTEQDLDNEEDSQRFIEEVKNLGNLSHPNIVSAIEAGIFEGNAYLAMEYINGITIEDKIDMEGNLSESQALKVCDTIAGALDHAWKKCKLIHRDLKPANFMIDKEGEIHLMDLGIAKRADENKDLTAIGIVMGTPYYMSPEQAKGIKNLDLRSDIYCLGASLYHMVTGHVPYEKKGTSGAVMHEKLCGPPVAPQKINPNLSKSMLNLIKKMMAKKPKNRPQSWKDVMTLIQIARKSKKSSSGSASKSVLNIEKPKFSTPAIIASCATFIFFTVTLIYFMVK